MVRLLEEEVVQTLAGMTGDDRKLHRTIATRRTGGTVSAEACGVSAEEISQCRYSGSRDKK